MPVSADVEKRFGRAFHLRVDFSFDHGCLAILGASGSGKSMLLRCIAGVETPSRGRIAVDDRVLYDSAARVDVRPQERRVGIMFQHYALFPNMTVAKNIGIGVRDDAVAKARIVDGFLERFHLEGMGGRYPGQLSGGQQQRVALARMLAAEPEVLLLDEPFSALDAHLREQVRLDMLDVIRDSPYAVMVTHNAFDAYTMSKNLLVLDNGRIVGKGITKELFRDPGHVRVAEIIGCGNMSRLEKLGPHSVRAVDWGLTLISDRAVPDNARFVGIREQDLEPVCDGGGNNVVAPKIRDQMEAPFSWNVFFSNAEATRAAEQGELLWKVEKRIFDGIPERLRLPPEALLFLRDD